MPVKIILSSFVLTCTFFIKTILLLMKYVITEKTFLVEKYLEKKSIVCVQREWRKYHGKKQNVPGSNTIRNIVKNFRIADA